MSAFSQKLRRTSTACLFLLTARPAFCAERTLQNVTFDEDYDVFYQEPFHVLMNRAKESIPRAYQSVTRQWGLDYPGLLHPLTVQVKELSSDTLVRTRVAYVQPQGYGPSLRQSLVIDIGCYMQHPAEDIDQVLRHEMAHVILMDILTTPQAAPIPPWFNEGLAQSVTREGHQRVRMDIIRLHRLSAALLLCDLGGPVDEFSNGPFNLNSGCYPEYYLAVQRLIQLGGPQTLSKVISGLRQGTPMEDLLPSIAGMDWSSFQRDVNRYAGEVFTGLKSVP